MTQTALAIPVVPRPVAYQQRARLVCAACIDGLDRQPRPYGGAVIPIPAATPHTPPVARRHCTACDIEISIPGLFGLGVLRATESALDACAAALTAPAALVARHWAGDWGEISPEDAGLNEDALRDGARLLSVYHLQGGGRVWIITEADRHATTLLLPQEY